MISGAVLLAGLTGYVAMRRGASAWLSLCVLLLSVAWWSLAYAVELTVDDLASKSHWGDLKYLGICALAPSLLVFVLRYTGRGRLVSRRLLVALTVEPRPSWLCCSSRQPTTWFVSTHRVRPGRNCRSWGAGRSSGCTWSTAT